MKKILGSILFILIFAACKSGKKTPDVSNIPITVHIERFDQALFAIDTNHVEQGLQDLGRQYPYFIGDYAVNILGTAPLSDTSAQAFFAFRRFVSSYMPVKDSLDLKFSAFGGMTPIEKGLQKGFQYLRYYFPKYNLPSHVGFHHVAADAQRNPAARRCRVLWLSIPSICS